MNKKLLYTFVALLILTGATAIVSMGAASVTTGIAAVILLLASIKVLLVVFNFMELSVAHRAWKVGFTLFLFAIVGGILLALP